MPTTRQRQPEKENAPLTLAGERGANTKQRGIAGVSIAHLEDVIYPDVFDETALAFAMMAADLDGVTDDMDAASELQAMGWPVRVWDIEVPDGIRLVPLWSFREWLEDRPGGFFDEWLQRFDDGLQELRSKAKGKDRAALEILDWYIDDRANRTSKARRALPSSTEYSAIAARTLKEQKHARKH